MRSMLHCRFRRAVMACFKHSRSSSSSLHSCNCCDTINIGRSGWSHSQKGRKPGKHPYTVLSTGLGEDKDSEPRTVVTKGTLKTTRTTKKYLWDIQEKSVDTQQERAGGGSKDNLLPKSAEELSGSTFSVTFSAMPCFTKHFIKQFGGLK